MKLSLRMVTLVAIISLFGITSLVAAAQSPTPQDKPAVSSEKVTNQAVPDPEIVALQEALNKFGANLKVDGVMGRTTRKALKKFQKENGLKVTGKLDEETKEKLGLNDSNANTTQMEEEEQTPPPDEEGIEPDDEDQDPPDQDIDQ